MEAETRIAAPPNSPRGVKRSVFRNLLFSMVGFGVMVGMGIPLIAKVVLDTDQALSPQFFALCIMVGLLVGLLNFMLYSVMVSRDLLRVVRGMQLVLENLEQGQQGVSPLEGSLLEVTSSDAIGEIEYSFNALTLAIARHLTLEGAAHALHADLSATVELEQVAARLLQSLIQAGGAKAGLLYGNTGDAFKLLAESGVDQSDRVPEEIPLKQGPIRFALQTGEVVTLSPEQDGLEWMEQTTPLGGFRPKNILTVPLMENQRATGVALLASTHRALHAEQTDQLEFLRTQGAPYLQTAVLHRKLRDLAAIDDLTQILNRRFGLRRLQEEFSRAVRHGTPVSVLLVDVDRFKSFNDTFGHEVGDEILKLVASNFEANLRSGDVVCRYGGEEFMVVAPGTGLQDAGILGERLRRMVATTELRWRDQALSVTVSLGVATWPMERVSVVEELIAAADKALYAAKQAGRNRTAAISGDLVQFYDSAG